MTTHAPVTGRFAPSPSGRMHLGNIYTALLSWLEARRSGGRWILRIEDLDPQRSKQEFVDAIIDDLAWLGLDHDAGGDDPEYRQSCRHAHYEAALSRLAGMGLTYPCRCTRAELRASQAPHASDGHVIYPGTCRPRPGVTPVHDARPASVRLMVPDETVVFDDARYGHQRVSLAAEFGDIVLRRADGAWAYQLAVTVDDALMGVTQVVRGADLLQSAAMQIYLHRLLGYEPPQYHHLPLLVNDAGQRLSKRDASLAMDALRRQYTPPQLVGHIARLAGLRSTDAPITARELLEVCTAR